MGVPKKDYHDVSSKLAEKTKETSQLLERISKLEA